MDKIYENDEIDCDFSDLQNKIMEQEYEARPSEVVRAVEKAELD